jgi:uncharacterized repeat protein (TIGR01451 family)
MGKGALRWLSASVLSVAILVASVGPGFAVSAIPPGGGDTPILAPGAQPIDPTTEGDAARLLMLDQAYIANRTAGDAQLTVEEAGQKRSQAASVADSIKQTPKSSSGPITFNSAWSGIGPNPIVQYQRSGTPAAVSGRIGALVIRKDGTFILGAAQGGIWTYSQATGVWTNRTDSMPSLSTGALAVAPSNDLIVYDGTGEGALSGDSYFGNGILKSTNGGTTWSHVSGTFFSGVSISRLAIDPANPNHLYAAVLRGRGGAKRVSPPVNSAFGVWESKDGAVTWKLLMPAPANSLGATELRMDPQNTKILYTSFWADKMYKSTDGGQTWAPIMNGLPANADYVTGLTRFAIGLSHPVGQAKATLYTGFDWFDPTGHRNSRIFKSTDEGANWTVAGFGTGNDRIIGYCGGQCFYDNVVEVDPTNPDIVYIAGQVGAAGGSIYRSDDGGASWVYLGYDQHPDFHALAFDPNNTAHILVGSDGGVWYSPNRGGRATTNDPLSAVDWQDLNGTVVVDPTLGIVVTHRTNLQITQFDSIGVVPQLPNRFWGGTQDNGTLRKSSGSQSWFDVASGDGGQALVNTTDNNCPLGACFVYGTYFNVSPYRYADGGNFFTNKFITNGINTNDRSDFYVPFVMNQLNPEQLFLGTYRLYRTDNAKAPAAGDVQWTAISPDLTSGCTGAPAPNGARNCSLSAIGVGGGTAVYTGSLDGFVYLSTDAQTSNNPTWTLLGNSGQNSEGDNQGEGGVKLPRRPVSQIAVDRSNYRVAYLAYAGFNGATANRPGHVFKTVDAGASWTDISGNLPDTPVNSLVLDPTYPNTLYAGTDVGPFVTYNGGRRWYALGTGFPVVAINQLDLNTYSRVLAAGTHGRGAFTITDQSAPAPALVLSKVDSGVPVGPGSTIDYTLTLHNIGNAAATGVTITDPIPRHTTFVSASGGGTLHGGTVRWTGLSVPVGVPGVGGSISVHLKVKIDPGLSSSVKSIVNDGFKATSAQRVTATGSPTVTPIAPPFGVSLSPAAQTGGAQVGQSQNYTVTLKNLGYKTDTYNLTSSAGAFTVSFYAANCTTPQTTTPPVISGATLDICVNVAVPNGTAAGTSVTSTITATSVGSPTVSASVTITTIAVTTDTLLVGEDGSGPGSTAPNVSAYYKDALTAAGAPYTFWDLGANPNLPIKYMTAFKNIVWYTGTSYPGPLAPYEGNLTTFLQGGGHLFMSGQDILDQGAGTTDFVKNYLHIAWDGTERQNDILTNHVTSSPSNPITGSIGVVPLDLSVLGGPTLAFMDEITIVKDSGAIPAFTDDNSATDALSYNGTYKVVFLAFPFEEYGGPITTPAQRTDLMKRVVVSFFGN